MEGRTTLKKNCLYLLPILIIIGLAVAFNYSLSKYQISKTVPAPEQSQQKATLNNNDTNVINTNIPKQQTPPAAEVKPAVSSTTPNTNIGPSIPILMYHEIGNGPNSLYVSQENFRAQMHYLRSNNYNIVTMVEARDMLVKGDIPPKTAVITFDDGYVSVYTRAWPILQEYGFPATVYVCSSFPGLYNYLTWDQIKILHDGGIEIGSHTRTHPALNSVSSAKLTEEVIGSKKELEEKLGASVNSFCYPSGAYNEYTPAVVKKAGYTSAVTVVNRKAAPKDDFYHVPRIRVPKAATISTFSDYLK